MCGEPAVVMEREGMVVLVGQTGGDGSVAEVGEFSAVY